MRIGYACVAIGVPGSGMKGCRKDHADDKTLMSVTAHNLDALERLVDDNVSRRITLFRISSDVIPFGSSPVNTLPWWDLFAEQLDRIARKIRVSGMRVSMHPGQYTILNAHDEDVVQRSVLDLAYHARFLDCLSADSSSKIILHVGGVYGDKAAAKSRFIQRCDALSQSVRRRLALENDERLFHIGDVLDLCRTLSLPAVFDNLHHAVNCVDRTASQPCPDTVWVDACRSTWCATDGPQKIHYAQQAPGKKPGAHRDTIDARVFVRDMAGLDPSLDVMLEVKDKNLSAMKCINCLDPSGRIVRLETEWARYKYDVLEHDPSAYQAVRLLLRQKEAYPVLDFYQMIDDALSRPVQLGHAINALQHVWGYFKDRASEAEKGQFRSRLERFRSGQISAEAVKRSLWRLAVQYQDHYLLNNLYLARTAD